MGVIKVDASDVHGAGKGPELIVARPNGEIPIKTRVLHDDDRVVLLIPQSSNGALDLFLLNASGERLCLP